jgi:hypothetical protein
MYKSLLFIPILIISICVASCKKDDSIIVSKESEKYKLSLYRNSKLFQSFGFNDQHLLSQINYDTMGFATEKIYYSYTAQKLRKDFFDADSSLQKYHYYKLDKNNRIDTVIAYYLLVDSFSDLNQRFIFKYSSNGKLDTIISKNYITNEHTDVSFNWSGENLKEKKYLQPDLPKNYYEYDVNPSIYNLIHVPIDVDIYWNQIAVIPISKNNIIKHAIYISDTLKDIESYNSDLTYDSKGYMSTENRHYINKTEKYEYKLDTLR